MPLRSKKAVRINAELGATLNIRQPIRGENKVQSCFNFEPALQELPLHDKELQNNMVGPIMCSICPVLYRASVSHVQDEAAPMTHSQTTQTCPSMSFPNLTEMSEEAQ